MQDATRRDTWVRIGAVDRFEAGRITPVPLEWPTRAPDGPRTRLSVYVRRNADGSFVVFHGRCPDTGAPLAWDPRTERFFCPCRGSVFDREGRVLAGPAPRPLDRHRWKVEAGVLYAGRISGQEGPAFPLAV
ncbi:MAG: hypothetical protein A2W08_15705 [Candidatus Rokubacteria bacterium RBG_16_73_20]|nr:MAG: hypothetical protein A2050_05115 [Candidatus Rokubacteria bacterium GWA2_73_35]OGK95427.1 MAG: hypothetical protein A2W08_15705 [Candidatus Rokubacteria bacterium RBG_16_73_20]HBH04094.1 hypothetical protein [Candidatus Rokubacteria bacterium]